MKRIRPRNWSLWNTITTGEAADLCLPTARKWCLLVKSNMISMNHTKRAIRPCIWCWKKIFIYVSFFLISVDRQLDTVISTWLMCSVKRHEGLAHSVIAVLNTRSFSTVGSGSEGLSKPYLISYTKPLDFGVISQTFFFSLLHNVLPFFS